MILVNHTLTTNAWVLPAAGAAVMILREQLTSSTAAAGVAVPALDPRVFRHMKQPVAPAPMAAAIDSTLTTIATMCHPTAVAAVSCRAFRQTCNELLSTVLSVGIPSCQLTPCWLTARMSTLQSGRSRPSWCRTTCRDLRKLLLH